MVGEYGIIMSFEVCGGEDKVIYGIVIIKDGGVLFVLEFKGNWKYVGFYFSIFIVVFVFFSFFYVMKGLGWVFGFLVFIIGVVVFFYVYMWIFKVFE